MTAFVLCLDVQSTDQDYSRLHSQLAKWRAAQLQESVWLADLPISAVEARDAVRAHMHPDDAIAIIQLDEKGQSACRRVDDSASRWLQLHLRA